MRRLYEGGAHLALGYSNWADYFEEQLRAPGAGGERSFAYKLLRAAEVEAEVSVHMDTRAMNKTQALFISASVKDPAERAALLTRVEAVGGFGEVTAPRMREMLQELRGQRRVVQLPEGTVVAWNPDIARQARQSLTLLQDAAQLLARANKLGHWVLPEALRALPAAERAEVVAMVGAARRDVAAAQGAVERLRDDLDRAALVLGDEEAPYRQQSVGEVIRATEATEPPP